MNRQLGKTNGKGKDNNTDETVNVRIQEDSPLNSEIITDVTLWEDKVIISW